MTYLIFLLSMLCRIFLYLILPISLLYLYIYLPQLNYSSVHIHSLRSNGENEKRTLMRLFLEHSGVCERNCILIPFKLCIFIQSIHTIFTFIYRERDREKKWVIQTKSVYTCKENNINAKIIMEESQVKSCLRGNRLVFT